ncbi:translation initiation factor IF-2 subunit beta [archaeon]|nr:translation initiation factor IF-2 subunit beta [archaeon]
METSYLDYTGLLERAKKAVPARASTGERFETQNFDSFIQGNQTIIRNFAEVSQKLRREPKHLVKYIAKELACIADLDGARALLKGKFKPDQLNSRLKNYVSEYVLCDQCGKPDTTFMMVESIRYKRCEVCGARSPIKQI